eukprot:g206.t1
MFDPDREVTRFEEGEMDEDSSNMATIISDVGAAESLATVSSLPGTTLAPIKVRMDNKRSGSRKRWFLYDTPGIVVNREKHNLFMDASLRKDLVPSRRRIRPLAFTMRGEKTFFLGGIARIDISFAKDNPSDRVVPEKKERSRPRRNWGDSDGRHVPGHQTRFIDTSDASRIDRRILMIWHGSTVPIHPTNTRGADALYARHAGKMLAPAAFIPAAEKERSDESMGTPVPMELLMEGSLWQFAGGAGLQEGYEGISASISTRKYKQRKTQRTSLLDIDIGGVGWLTFACSVDDRTKLQKRRRVLEEALVRVWGHPALGAPVVRPPLIPLGASQLKRKEWKTL